MSRANLISELASFGRKLNVMVKTSGKVNKNFHESEMTQASRWSM